MGYKENTLYSFIQLELLRLKNLTKILEKSNLEGIKITSTAHRVVCRAQDPRLAL